MRIDSRIKWLAFALILFVFAKSWEPGVGLDTATYGAIARDILQNGSWFNPKLAPGIFDPFVEHPYLVLWLDALSLKVWGANAFGIHFTSSVLGIIGVLAFFAAIRRLVDENTALISTILLLTINVFMNFMSSGWLDMPMVAFILVGFYFSSRISNSSDIGSALLSGFFLSFAILTKGAAAIGVLPVLLFAGTRLNWRPKPLLTLSVGILTPLIAFTIAHYHSQGFVFWERYFYRQFIVQNDAREASYDPVGWIWYIRDTINHAHLVALLFIPGLVLLWKKQYRSVAAIATLQFLIHLAVYAFSNRHNRQYLLPIFPWLALGAGYLVSLRWKLSAEKWTKGLLGLSAIYFMAVTVLPITVHSMGGPEIHAFKETIKNLPIERIYFQANEIERLSGEATSSYIAWYWQKTPVMFTPEELPKIVASIRNGEAVFIIHNEDNKHFLTHTESVCAWNDPWILYSTKETCTQMKPKNLVNND
ncbi:glycosyltransferase family 39 protein [Bdellovibrio sp. SKB1291214]|uniref:ArnT family glycosyltransferase n=1 Tax=Bdellovibrio sp. SKB1291214 TaxID=1732569 RepID=UPI000B51B7CD|nr:glycosyltransferase family 39 protein [Bdellovibrio sp. SKB1291214]UYL08285.1 glycosyltransferase family 39 protein [Bdellovibrio sp. SKB1291214]